MGADTLMRSVGVLSANPVLSLLAKVMLSIFLSSKKTGFSSFLFFASNYSSSSSINSLALAVSFNLLTKSSGFLR